MTTIVTGLFDINRIQLDGRSWSSYLTWFEKTLSINAPMVVFVEEKTYDFVKSRRNDDNTKIVVQTINDLEMYKYKDRMDKTISSNEYRRTIKDAHRIECKNSLYTIIQFSKFYWMNQVANDNPFASDYFIWMDAGLSRFFDDLNTSNRYPSERMETQLLSFGDRTFIQTFCCTYPDLFDASSLSENYLLDNRSYVMGGLFGGNANVIPILKQKVEYVFEHLMLNKNIVNNEQIVLGYLFKTAPELFSTFVNNNNIHRNYEVINALGTS